MSPFLPWRKHGPLGIVMLALFASALMVPSSSVLAKFAGSGIGCNNNATFLETLLAAQSGDLLAPVDTDSSLGPTAQIAQSALTIQGDWRYTGSDFPPPTCFGSDSANSPPPFFSHDGDRHTFFGSGSGSAAGDGPLVTATSAVRNLEIDQLGLSGAWSATNGGLLAGTIQGQANVILRNLELTNGKTDQEGGALALTISGGSTVVITGDPCPATPCQSRISTNQSGASYSSGSAPGSGGILIDVREGSHLIIENTEIDGNTAAGSSGGFKIIVRDGSSVILRNNRIHDNTSQGLDVATNADPRNGGGGRIQIFSGSVQVLNNDFTNNSADQGHGGALSVEQADPAGTALLQLSGNTFSGNQAALGDDDVFLSGTFLQPQVFVPVTIH